MKILIGLIAIFTLSGCVNMQDLRNKKPDITYATNKSVNEVSSCILADWQVKVFRYGNVFVQDNINLNNGKTVYSETQSEMADVFTDNDMTRINFYHQSALFFYRVNDRIDSIKRCL